MCHSREWRYLSEAGIVKKVTLQRWSCQSLHVTGGLSLARCGVAHQGDGGGELVKGQVLGPEKRVGDEDGAFHITAEVTRVPHTAKNGALGGDDVGAGLGEREVALHVRQVGR